MNWWNNIVWYCDHVEYAIIRFISVENVIKIRKDRIGK